ncbi:hypothetical protein HY486_03325, partial [Candidatus Woesearchaeota archaeon]|nr:hypothetical protein [Candidatus Woesearchaeota archaeon]
MTIESTIKGILANITEGVENASDVKLRKMPTLIYDKESTLNKIGRTSA